MLRQVRGHEEEVFLDVWRLWSQAVENIVGDKNEK